MTPRPQRTGAPARAPHARLVALARPVRTRLLAAAVVLTARARRLVGDAGMSTAEYAVGTVAAVSFAAALIAVVRSDAVRQALTSIITGALRVG